MPIQRYSDFLEISPSFESVVDIDADKRNKNLWREYIVGDDMETLVDFLCQSLGNEAVDARRSFWIHGSYGTGKSYAAIFVKHLIEEKPEIIDEFLQKSNRLSQFRNRFMKCRKNGDYLVVWKTGCTGIRSGDMMLLEAEKAIRDALIEKYGDKADLGSASLIQAVKDKLDDPSINWAHILDTTTLGDDFGTVEELRERITAGDLTALQATATVIRQRGFGLINNLETFKAWTADVIDNNGLSKSGIFFIWDEFTEYVAHSDDHTVMQQISEFCKEKPLFMLYVVHKSQEMVNSMGKEQYQLITHRFHETEFHVSADAAFDLIAGSINIRNGMNETWKEERKQVVKNIKPHLPDMSGLDDKISEQIDLLCPMHPMTIKLLSRVAESFAAAQRTMFRFMKDQSTPDQGFIGYINKYGPNDQACWLTAEWLWDYFFTRDSDFSDKDTKVPGYIHHYEESRHLVENDENAHRVFKVAMLLLAVMSTAKGVYGGKKAQGGISATVDCLQTCLAGVMSKSQITDLLDTLEDCKILLRDESANGVVRLQMPFKGGSGDDFKARFETNDRKYSRYMLFSKDGVFAQEFEKQALDQNDASFKRMKVAVCCAENLSIKNRREEIQKELDKAPYKIGLLIVTVRDDAQYMAIQKTLEDTARDSNESRLVIALVKTPLDDEKRKSWLTSTTRMEMARASGLTADAQNHEHEAKMVVSKWVNAATSGSKIIAWNGTQVFNNQYGMANLRKTIQTNVRDTLFPYAPESIVVTSTAYKPCSDAAAQAGTMRKSNNAQMNNVLNALNAAGILPMTSIEEMAVAEGNKAAKSIAALANLVRTEMGSGKKVVLSELWETLQRSPFGYYDTIACGILLGIVFSCYKEREYSWTDAAQGTHILSEATLASMVSSICKGKVTTDYLSAGSITWQNFSDYLERIFALTKGQLANETEGWHNVREAVIKAGAPFWALKYLPESTWGTSDHREAALKIIDNIQLFIAQDHERENAMSTVLQLFNGRAKVRVNMAKSFQDKTVMAAAFRTFLFSISPKLQEITTKLSVQPEDLLDKVFSTMQGAVYSWTEEQVQEKISGVVSEYAYLDALNFALGKVYHSPEEAKKDLVNLFKYMRISMAAIEPLTKPWYPALQILHRVSKEGITHMTLDSRDVEAKMLFEYGKAAKDCLSDGKAVLSDILESRGWECTTDELDSIYTGLKEMSCESSLSQFNKELDNQVSRIQQARNRLLLQAQWQSLTGEESVKKWCGKHNAPLMWIVAKDFQKAISTVIDVQNNARTLDQNVQNAIAALKQVDVTLLTDDKKIEEAFLRVIGTEFKELFAENRTQILAKAKFELGNDMSTWAFGDLTALQRIMKKALQEKAKKEKLEATKSSVKTMKEENLRNRVLAFLDAHPEFCDDFSE